MGATRIEPPGRGRPRDRALDDRILEQVLFSLGSHGYAGLTLDELAARSGVARTTILRRWQSKAAVAAAGVERLAPQSGDVPHSDTLRVDLLALLHGAEETFLRGELALSVDQELVIDLLIGPIWTPCCSPETGSPASTSTPSSRPCSWPST